MKALESGTGTGFEVRRGQRLTVALTACPAPRANDGRAGRIGVEVLDAPIA